MQICNPSFINLSQDAFINQSYKNFVDSWIVFACIPKYDNCCRNAQFLVECSVVEIYSNCCETLVFVDVDVDVDVGVW